MNAIPPKENSELPPYTWWTIFSFPFRRTGNTDRDYGLSCNLTFSNSGQTEHTFGLYELLKSPETSTNGPWMDSSEGIERIIFGPDLSTFDFTEYT